MSSGALRRSVHGIRDPTIRTRARPLCRSAPGRPRARAAARRVWRTPPPAPASPSVDRRGGCPVVRRRRQPRWHRSPSGRPTSRDQLRAAYCPAPPRQRWARSTLRPDARAIATATATPEACPGAIAWDPATAHVGQIVTVRGPVMDGTFAWESRGQPTFLNLGLGYPDPARFSVVIWIPNRANFPAPPEEL